MSTNQRQIAYGVLAVIYAGAVACQQQGVFPATWTAGVGAVAIIASMLMKEFGAKDPEAK